MHKNIIYLTLYMYSTGVDVMPPRQITGEAELNEVLLDGFGIKHTGLIGYGLVDAGGGAGFDRLATSRL